MANPILRSILCSLLIWGSSFLVPHYLYAQTGWGTATSLGQNFTPKAQVPKIAMDPQGNAIAVWAQGNSTGVLSIWANRYDVKSGSWGTPALIEQNSGVATLPQIGVDNNGNAVAVWVQNDGTFNRMMANRYVAGQGWGTPQVIESNTGDADFPRVAVNGSGNAMALWKQFMPHGLALIEALLARGDLEDYHLVHAARADLCRRLGRTTEAQVSYERALGLTQQEPERRFLQRRLNELQ